MMDVGKLGHGDSAVYVAAIVLGALGFLFLVHRGFSGIIVSVGG